MTREQFDILFKQFSPVQNNEEMWSLINKVLQPSDIKYIVEIGIAAGGSAGIWMELCKEKDATYIGIDDNLKQAIRIKEDVCPYILIEGRSQMEETWKKLDKMLDGERVDFLFVDGDHGHGALLDTIAYSPFVRSGGIIAFHDIGFGGMVELLNKVKNGETFQYTNDGIFWEEPHTSTLGIHWFRKK